MERDGAGKGRRKEMELGRGEGRRWSWAVPPQNSSSTPHLSLPRQGTVAGAAAAEEVTAAGAPAAA
eukprot:2105439-Rhodomonas_salina.1